ncbi:arginase family protein [Klebsiella michiganensis]|uniref:arginase family protein n=1 Tax=Klebsiella michiganensis TaxID=1134687 RepID=UPI003992AC1B
MNQTKTAIDAPLEVTGGVALRALTKKHGPVGLIHVDAHTDTNDEMFGEKIAHGTTFRRAVEEGLLDLKRVVQIGQRAQDRQGNGVIASQRQRDKRKTI